MDTRVFEMICELVNCSVAEMEYERRTIDTKICIIIGFISSLTRCYQRYGLTFEYVTGGSIVLAFCSGFSV